MDFALSVHDLRLVAKSPAVTFTLRPGEVLAVFGPSGSGKSRFLRALCGLEGGRRGAVRIAGEAVLAGTPPLGKRATPAGIARKGSGRAGAARAAECLNALRLWELRHTPVASLTPGSLAAAELIEPLASGKALLLVDGQLDRLDPWARRSALDLLATRLRQGAAAVVATGLPELAPRADRIVVWREGLPVFSGSYAELESRHGWSRIELETTEHRGVRALCDPFEVQIETEDSVSRLRAREGQALAAKLLRDGYGDVKAVVLRRPNPEDLLASLT